MAYRYCLIPGCSWYIETPRILCKKHYFMLSPYERRELSRAVRKKIGLEKTEKRVCRSIQTKEKN